MEITPTPLAQVKLGDDGREYEIAGDAGALADRIQKEIDASLRVRFNESTLHFVIYQLLDAGRFPVTDEKDATRRSLVMRVPMGEWDGRVIRELEPRAWDIRHGISRAATLDAGDARRSADIDYRAEQETAALAYPLFRAIQRETLGMNPRAFIRSGLSR